MGKIGLQRVRSRLRSGGSGGRHRSGRRGCDSNVAGPLGRGGGSLVRTLRGRSTWTNIIEPQGNLGSEEKVVESFEANLGGVEKLLGRAGLDVRHQAGHTTDGSEGRDEVQTEAIVGSRGGRIPRVLVLLVKETARVEDHAQRCEKARGRIRAHCAFKVISNDLNCVLQGLLDTVPLKGHRIQLDKILIEEDAYDLLHVSGNEILGNLTGCDILGGIVHARHRVLPANLLHRFKHILYAFKDLMTLGRRPLLNRLRLHYGRFLGKGRSRRC
mmetsp:Transcript_7187/g.14551  ORF Transcript_7187/g.14551 Transcript_7187/m.14551 type:complete len:271 (+) Transcript_7187:4268-5080(+)